MGKYALFLGCTIPYRIPFAEVAIRQTLQEFNIELIDLPFGCCPDPGGVQAFDSVVWLTLAARNLVIAEAQKLNILTACSGCFETLKIANTKLKENIDLRNEVNSYLSEIGREFKGTIDVKHFGEVYYYEIGLERIASKVTNPLTGFKFATHSGCHFNKPPEILKTDNPERPHLLDELVEATGAQSIPYLKKLMCCGAGTRGVDQPVSVSIAHEKIVEVQKANADGIVTICPSCFVSYDIGQILMEKQFGVKTNIPVFVYPELLGISMGLDLSTGLKMHTIKTKEFLSKIAST